MARKDQWGQEPGRLNDATVAIIGLVVVILVCLVRGCT